MIWQEISDKKQMEIILSLLEKWIYSNSEESCPKKIFCLEILVSDKLKPLWLIKHKNTIDFTFILLFKILCMLCLENICTNSTVQLEIRIVGMNAQNVFTERGIQ